MRLAARFVLVLFLAVTAILSFYGYIRVRREIDLFETEMRHSFHVLAETLGEFVLYVWNTAGEAEALVAVQRANEERADTLIRWVWLDAPSGGGDAPQLSRKYIEGAYHNEEVFVRARGPNKDSRFYLYQPLVLPDGRAGCIEISESAKRMDEYLRTTFYRILSITFLVAVVCGVGALWIGIWFLGRPLRLLIAKTRRVAAGDLSEPLSLPRRAELTELAAAFNAMCKELSASQERVRAETAARIDALEQLRHADRLRTVGRLASGVAHELGTPLNVVSARAGMIATGKLTEEQMRENAAIVKDQAHRITAIVQQLLAFARRQPVHRTPADLRRIVRETVALMAPLGFKKKTTVMSADGGEGAVRCVVDAGQIQQVLTNLIGNAIYASSVEGAVTVGVDRMRAMPPKDLARSEGEYARVYVRDTGKGIPDRDMPHLFEPFFTTKDVGEGTGLGLAIAHGIVREHEGWIAVESEIGKGSCFSVYLPLETD